MSSSAYMGESVLFQQLAKLNDLQTKPGDTQLKINESVFRYKGELKDWRWETTEQKKEIQVHQWTAWSSFYISSPEGFRSFAALKHFHKLYLDAQRLLDISY